MRILVLAPTVPDPSDPRSDMRTLEVLRFLGREHEVTLLAFCAEEVDTLVLQALSALCASVRLIPVPDARRRGFLSPKENVAEDPTYPLGRKNDSLMHVAVDEALRARHFDVIHLADVAMAQFVPEAWDGSVVLDERSEHWRRLLRTVEARAERGGGQRAQREARQLRAFETAACRRSTVILAADEEARAELERFVGASWAVHVAPLSIDVGLWGALWRSQRPRTGRLLTVSRRVSVEEHLAIAWLMRHVDTLLRLQLPYFRHDIVGGPFSKDLRVLALDHEEVALIEDLRRPASSWESATVYLAPPLREGLAHHGILEALAAGVPIVASSLVLEGLPLEHNRHALIADTPEEMAAAVLRLYQEPALARHLAAEGHRLVCDRYDVGVASAAISAAYEHVAVGEVRCALCS